MLGSWARLNIHSLLRLSQSITINHCFSPWKWGDTVLFSYHLKSVTQRRIQPLFILNNESENYWGFLKSFIYVSVKKQRVAINALNSYSLSPAQLKTEIKFRIYAVKTCNDGIFFQCSPIDQSYGPHKRFECGYRFQISGLAELSPSAKVSHLCAQIWHGDPHN